MTTHVPESRCLHCGHKLDAATGVGHHDAPEPGNLSLCINCGAVTIYAEDLTLRGMTREEMDALTNDRETMSFLVRQVQKIHMLPKLNWGI
jgi:hypothetical protein